MQCASDGPRNCVLTSETTPPTAVMPSQIAMYSGRFGIIRQTVSPLASFCVERPARIAVGALDQRAIGQGVALRDQRLGVALAVRQFLDGVEQEALRTAGNRRRRLERAHPVAQRGVVRAAAVARRAIHLDEGHALASRNKVNLSLQQCYKIRTKRAPGMANN